MNENAPSARSAAELELAIREKISSEIADYRSHLETQMSHFKWAITSVSVVLVTGLFFFLTNSAEGAREMVRTQVADKLSEPISAAVQGVVAGAVAGAKPTIERDVSATVGQAIARDKIVPELDRIFKEKLEEIRNADLTGLVVGLPVGSIVASVVQPESLPAADADRWVLADGRTVPATSLYTVTTGRTSVPDLRGLFLRGLNGSRADGLEDPGGAGRTPGDTQRDAFASHAHATFGNSSSGVANGDNANYLTIVSRGQVTAATGELETRPRNAAVYFYIKIN